MKGSAYLRLMRFDKPVGILLLWFPTAWALWLAGGRRPGFHLILYFFLGTVVMRSAGCVVNDIADRHLDKHVQRTQGRPLTNGELGLLEALVLLFGLFLLAFFILIQLPSVCFYYALASLFITILYPFCKRFFQAPQLVLGLAFSMGIPMAYAAMGIGFNTSMILLFILNVAWIVCYDTLYAMTDREDDLRIGVKSTAVLFADHDRLIIFLLQLCFHGLWLMLAFIEKDQAWFYCFWMAAGLVLIYQQKLLARREAKAYFTAFLTNVWYGAFMWAALLQ